MRSKILIIIGGILLWSAVARGEDSWLIADNHAVNDGEPLWLSFVTGQVFPIGDAPSNPADVVEFIDVSGNDLRRVSGYARQDRGVSIRRPIKGGGIHVIGCTLAREVVAIPAEEFDDYLKREHAEQALAVRAQQTGSRPIVREAYTKFAKTIVEVHPAGLDVGGYDTPLGHRLEIIPLSNPCRWQDDAIVEVQVRLDGYGWSGVAVSAGHEGSESEGYTVQTTTDSKGVARIPLTRPGHWFIRAHLIRPTDGIGQAEWESFWASLTFRVAGPVDVSEALRTIRAVRQVVQPWLVAGFQVAHRALGEVAREVFVMTPLVPGRRSPVVSLPRSPGRSVRPASASPLASR